MNLKYKFKDAKQIKKLKGFGASAAWWSTAVPENKTDEIAKLLYSKEGLGMNIYRYNVGGGFEKQNCRVESTWRNIESFLQSDGEYDYSKDANAVRMMKKCLELGCIDTLIFFANSPHYSQTVSGQASGGFTEHFSNLPKSNYESFAKYFLDITEHFINSGYPVKFISPINEPQWKWGGESVWQEGCHYEPNEVRDVFHIFAQEIEKRKLDVLLYGPESGNITDHTQEYAKLLFADPLIKKHLGAFAYHSYGSDFCDKNKKDIGKWAEKNVFPMRFDMSEWCELPCKNDITSDTSMLNMVRIIGEDLIFSKIDSWTAWVAANQWGINEDDGKCYCDGLITATDDFSKYCISQRYYALAHFSKYIKSGSKSLQTGNEKSQGFCHFLFKTPDDKFISVCANGSKKARTVEPDIEFSKAKIILSDKNNHLKEILTENAKKITIEPFTAVTIIWG